MVFIGLSDVLIVSPDRHENGIRPDRRVGQSALVEFGLQMLWLAVVDLDQDDVVTGAGRDFGCLLQRLWWREIPHVKVLGPGAGRPRG